MEKKDKDLYIRSGRILTDALKLAEKETKEGTGLLHLAEKIEKFIIEEGGHPAFPVNISINNIAAHFSPAIDNTQMFSEKDVAKVDIGVHIDGHITDSAVTIDLSGKYGKMVEASKAALEAAVSLAKPGLDIRKLGKEIEKEILKAGFKPISNLSGHRIDEWVAHASPSVPNIETSETKKLEPGNVYAIEPFATDGAGFVHEGVQAEIFGFDRKLPLRSMSARKIIDLIEEEYDALPFAQRWVSKKLKIPEFELKVAFREMLSKKIIHAYPVLKELDGKTVTQAETTLLIEEKDVLRLVK